MASCNAETTLSKVNITVDDFIGVTSLVKGTSLEKDQCNGELKSSGSKRKAKKKRQKKLQNGNGELHGDTSSIKNDSIESDCCLKSTVDLNKKTDANCEVDINTMLDLKSELDVDTKMSLKSEDAGEPKTDLGPSELSGSKKKRRGKKLKQNKEDTSSIKNDSMERDCFLESAVDVNKKTDVNCEVDINTKEFKSEVNVDTNMNLKPEADSDPNTGLGSSELSQSQKKRRSKKLKWNQDAVIINNKDDAPLETRELYPMENGSIEKDLCLESEVDICTKRHFKSDVDIGSKTESKSEVDNNNMIDLIPLELSSSKKRKRNKKQKQKDNAILINDVDHSLLEADQSDLRKNSSIKKGSYPRAQIDIDLKKELKPEVNTNAETELRFKVDINETADLRPELSCSQKNRRKTHKQKHSSLLTNDEDRASLEVEELVLMKNSFSPCLVSEVDVNAEIDSKSEVDVNKKTGLKSEADINSMTDIKSSELGFSKKKRKRKSHNQEHHAAVNKDKVHAAQEVEELDLTEMEENCLIVDERISLPSTESATLMKKCENNSKDALVLVEKEDVKTYQRKEESKAPHRERTKFPASLANNGEPIIVAGKTSLDHSNEEHLFENKLEGALDGKGDASMMVVKNVSMKKILSDCSNGDFTCKRSKEMLEMKNDVDIEGRNQTQVLHVSLEQSVIRRSKKKLLVLDINGLLVDVVERVPNGYRADIKISKKSVFKRPFCDDFLKFCFEKFNVGIWSSRRKKNVEKAVDFLLGNCKHKLLFCWTKMDLFKKLFRIRKKHKNQSHCTRTRFKTIENKKKPLVLKELKILWEKAYSKGEYDESNTLLLDDSPYKALRNPVHNAIFPHSYCFRRVRDSSLGPRGDLRMYLARLAEAPNVQEFVAQNPFGQGPITESNPKWGFYQRIIGENK